MFKKTAVLVIFLITLSISLGCGKSTGETFITYEEFKVIGNNEDGTAHFYIMYKNKRVFDFLGVYGDSLVEAQKMNAFKISHLIKGSDGQLFYENRDGDDTNKTNYFMVFDLDRKKGTVKNITPSCKEGILENKYLVKDVDEDGNQEILEILSPFDSIRQDLDFKIPRSYLAFSYDKKRCKYIPAGKKCRKYLLKTSPQLFKENGDLYSVLMTALPFWSACDSKSAWKIFDTNYQGADKEIMRGKIKMALSKVCFECADN